ncbi:6-phosphofructokinase [Treponema zuelzerae]|uniref:ATP-dependent 6-phosphofructokinase n=1 Tax=Teretinema zuelzerae TaxID=156 RepID=A0AAE3EKV4_9SPIR|nr:ATP-dependent 6-phosphofructokinase [Teretinema zuelzerae]MCD1655746.1 6-phosphofructokinase [Teretinema zuelzerae]
MQKSVTKICGILTSGGDAPGLNAAIRGVCRTAIDIYGMKVIGFEHGYRGLIENKSRVLNPSEFSGILAQGGTILGTSREKPFKDKNWCEGTGPCAVEMIIDTYKKNKLDCLVTLGGNGTNTTASLLAKEGLNVIGLPKTIDNDIVETDITFGFHTALTVATDAIDRLHSTASSHNRVMVIEVMGHKAGWLSLYSGVAGGGDVVLLPEIPYDIESIARHLENRGRAGKTFSIVVVAEGARSVEESRLDKKAFKKAREQMSGSIGYRVAREIQDATGLESRVTVLGYLQRGGTPVAFDRVLASQFGTAAANMLAEGNYGKMVALQDNRLVGVPLENVANRIKSVPVDHRMIETARDVGTCLGD